MYCSFAVLLIWFLGARSYAIITTWGPVSVWCYLKLQAAGAAATSDRIKGDTLSKKISFSMRHLLVEDIDSSLSRFLEPSICSWTCRYMRIDSKCWKHFMALSSSPRTRWIWPRLLIVAMVCSMPRSIPSCNCSECASSYSEIEWPNVTTGLGDWPDTAVSWCDKAKLNMIEMDISTTPWYELAVSLMKTSLKLMGVRYNKSSCMSRLAVVCCWHCSVASAVPVGLSTWWTETDDVLSHCSFDTTSPPSMDAVGVVAAVSRSSRGAGI
mmetsp:Transcript_17517/g.42623  ORF Transcript_17517/g.42623 Transcript_17517/m.42623 type:complete len:268 (-) Transcript_17517:798-1601(-)